MDSTSTGGSTLPNKSKLGVALVGLGKYASEQLAPALKLTQYCELKGIVTGSPEKIPRWKTDYGIRDQNIYNYDNFEEIASNEEIDIVYIVLPNSQHGNYTVRAANAGKHVICEKPMAISVHECEEMIEVCKRNNVKLGIGYRLHFIPIINMSCNLVKEQWENFRRWKVITRCFWKTHRPGGCRRNSRGEDH